MTMSRLGYVALKYESGGRGVAVKPTKFLPYKGGDLGYKQEILTNDPIQNVRHKAIEALKGKIETDGDLSFNCDARSLVYVLFGVFGKYTVASLGSGAYKHTLKIANKLPSFTIEQAKGDITGTDISIQRSFGTLFDSIEISGSDGMLDVKTKTQSLGAFLVSFLKATAPIGTPASIVSNQVEGLVVGDSIRVTETTGASPSTETTTIVSVTPETKTITANLTASKDLVQEPIIELMPQTPTFDDERTRPTFSFTNAEFRQGADLTAAASATTLGLEDWSVSFENGVEARYGSKRATPTTLAEKGTKMTIKWKKLFETNEDRNKYVGVKETAIIFSLVHDRLISTSNQAYKIDFKLPRVMYTAVEMPTGVDDVFVVQCEAEVYYDGTQGEAVIVEIYNDIADAQV